MSTKACFVVMPIRRPGTPEHSHFRAIYNNIRPVLERANYSTIRADDIQKSGAITKDIVTRLGESDLVIADLTDLNANVFYELGVRHALRGTGTVMILDEQRTADIPFDLSAYRVIKFTGDLTGIDGLTQGLEQFLAEDGSDGTTHRDNPVHDWFPMLPINVLDNSAQSSSAPLRKTIKQLQERLLAYEKAYGSDLPGAKSTKTPLSTVLAALSDAEDGLVPASIMESARKAYETRDVVALLKTVRVVIERNIRLAPTMFIALVSWAQVMDLDEVVKAIFDQALQLYPSDRNLKRVYLQTLCHSDSPGDRERARAGIAQELSIDLTAATLDDIQAEKVRREMDLFVVLLDSYQRDQMHREELTLTERLVKVLPDSPRVLRNYARALSNNGHDKEALKYFREALLCIDADDSAAMWLGNELHNQRRHREAAEAYAVGCLLDAADASNFAHLAEELSILFDSRAVSLSEGVKGAALLKDLEPQSIVMLARCAASCSNMDAETADTVRRALDRMELGAEMGEAAPVPRPERVQLIQQMLSVLQTGLTTRGVAYEF